MNKISKNGLLIFIIFTTGIIIFLITTAESFGDDYIEELRIADADETLAILNDDIVIEIGKSICNEANDWMDEEISLFSIQNILLKNEIEVKKQNRIIPILRFHAIYELCPENIDVLDEIFGNNE
tara:strand:+ start:90 stop:464 length:375 start_codon:yes stop_codon:yes gene_type:complete